MTAWVFVVLAVALLLTVLDFRREQRKEALADLVLLRARSWHLAEPGVYRSRISGLTICWSRGGWQVRTPAGIRREHGVVLCVKPTLRLAKLAASATSTLVYR